MLDSIANVKIATVAAWQRESRILIGLTLLVGILGLASGALQGSGKGWAKAATVGVGLAVSAITLTTNTVFSADYRTLSKHAVEGHKIIENAQLSIRTLDPTSPGLRAAAVDIMNTLHQVDDLATEAPTQNASLGLVRNLYAQESAQQPVPEWVSHPPSADKTHLFFLGVGEASTVAEAAAKSFTDGRERATKYLTQAVHAAPAQGVAPSDTALIGYAKTVVEKEATFFSYDRGKRLYRYFTLVRLDKSSAQVGVINMLVKGSLP
jgi:hypothetical protein